jgi:uncharacterized peroxidase-related enzyme
MEAAPRLLRARAIQVAGAQEGAMPFLRVLGDGQASGEVAEIFNHERERLGYVMEATRSMSTRPEVLVAWERFYSIVRGGFSLPVRDWRLITLVAAKRIRSTYCSLVYGKALVRDLGSEEAVLAVQRDFRRAGLSERDVAMLEYAEQITERAHSVTETDVERLRQVGFSDEQIFDIALCASLRSFMSRLFDAVGALPDEELRALDARLREPLVVGRPLD